SQQVSPVELHGDDGADRGEGEAHEPHPGRHHAGVAGDDRGEDEREYARDHRNEQGADSAPVAAAGSSLGPNSIVPALPGWSLWGNRVSASSVRLVCKRIFTGEASCNSRSSSESTLLATSWRMRRARRSRTRRASATRLSRRFWRTGSVSTSLAL